MVTSICPSHPTSEETEFTTTEPEKTTQPEASVHQIIDITRHSKLTKLYRVTDYVLRFITNIKKLSQKKRGPLTVSELNRAQNL